MDEQKTSKRKSKEEEKFTAKKQKIETEETKVYEIIINNFEVRSMDNYKSDSFQEIVKKLIEKIKEEQEQLKTKNKNRSKKLILQTSSGTQWSLPLKNSLDFFKKK